MACHRQIIKNNFGDEVRYANRLLRVSQVKSTAGLIDGTESRGRFAGHGKNVYYKAIHGSTDVNPDWPHQSKQ